MCEEAKRKERAFNAALDTRKFEIGLFWQRSLFFWGFIASAFVAYAAIWKEGRTDHDLLLTVSAFGVICSVAWTLANRGSKYWQGAWEAKLETVELEVLGMYLFKDKYTPLKEETHFWGVWSGNNHYSVSRLTTALSDFTVGVWIVLFAKALPAIKWSSCFYGPIVITALTVLYVVAMFVFCRSSNKAKLNLPAPKTGQPL